LREPADPQAQAFLRALAPVERRLRLSAIASAVLSAAAAAGAVLGVALLLDAPLAAARVTAAVTFALVAAAASRRWAAQWTPLRVAGAIEDRIGALDNILVTAAETAVGRRHAALHRVISAALWQAADERLRRVDAVRVQPLLSRLALATAAVAGVAAVMVFPPAARRVTPVVLTAGAADAGLAPGDLRVTVQPPAYTGRAATTVINPAEIAVIEGTRVALEVAGTSAAVTVHEAGQPAAAFQPDAGGRRYDFTAAATRTLLIEQEGASDRGRLLHVRVDPDRRPTVRIAQPGKDLVVAAASGEVGVEVEARDDLGLASVTLRYTRVSGSGESFTFEEGEIPLALQRTSDAEWKGRASLPLGRLKLEDGDTLVYRAVAADRKPGADPSASDTFLIEVGRVGGIAATGFAVPDERERQGLSQQMLIMKTERLHGERAKLRTEELLEQARLLAVEQRMVRAEFVFMTGGEVEDEVAEAEAGHELAEGRQENQNQADLLAAIREMSRAEARLNTGDTGQALAFERAALRALQRAFDRRRYLLRTLPERTRLDPSRRLSGDLQAARSSVRERPPRPPDPIAAAARAALTALGADAALAASPRPGLAAALLAVDPDAADLRRLALVIASSGDPRARLDAAREAERALAARLQARLAAPALSAIPRDPLSGRVADRLSRQDRR
jgi:hypothetical protein